MRNVQRTGKIGPERHHHHEIDDDDELDQSKDSDQLTSRQGFRMCGGCNGEHGGEYRRG